MTSLHLPRGADAARLLYADAARRLSDFARQLVPTSREHGGGDYLREALLAVARAERLVALAVVVERAQGTTWEAIGEVAGGIAKQSAQKKWADTAGMVADLVDGIPPDVLRSLHVDAAGQLADDLDAWYARHVQPGESTDQEHAVSGYLLDPGPAPDLSDYDTTADEAYEWLLSDHPWAQAERIRRAEATAEAELGNAAAVRDWTDRINGLDIQQRYPGRFADIGENLTRLAELMRPLADEQQVRGSLDAAEPDDVRVPRLRQQWITHKHAGGDDSYTYPAHLLGPGAAAYPPPGLATRPDA